MKLRRFDYKIKETKPKPIIISSIVVLILLTGITIYVTQARYKVTNTYNLLSGKVKEFFNSDISLEIKIIDESGNIITSEEFPPKKEYTYDSERSYCENESTIAFNKEDWTATISTEKKDKCTIYFKYGAELAIKIKEQAIEKNYLYSTTPNFGSITEDGEYGLYQAPDDYGTSYYFRGDVEDNYVQFGSYKAGSTVNGTTYTKETPMYWRIVRINGDGTIRMIYDGTELIANGTANNVSIGTTVFNAAADDSKYVGYTYEEDGVETDSSVKSVADAWYKDHFYETKYEEYIADSIFCNDRKVTSTSGTIQYFGARDRLQINYSPVLTCTQDSDKYTTANNTIGNKLLKYPIGLITADEVMMAGVIRIDSNGSYYLYRKSYNWTMSPHSFNNAVSQITIWVISMNGGYINSSYHNGENRVVRPVINLNADILFTGDGSISNPYKLILAY